MQWAWIEWIVLRRRHRLDDDVIEMAVYKHMV